MCGEREYESASFSLLTHSDGRRSQVTESYCVFLWKEGVTPSDIARRLSAVFGDDAMQQRTVYKWVQRYAAGRESLEDDPRSGRPATCVTPEMINTVKGIVSENRCITVREIAAKAGIESTRQVHDILTIHLEMRKLTARWVPRLLSNSQKQDRVAACRELLRMSAQLGESFWSRLITVDETWLPFYLPESKEQSKQWCRVGEHPPLKAKTVPSAGKVMITAFWHCDGVILIDYLQKGVTINSAYYSHLLSHDLRAALKNRRRGKLSSKPLLQQDNARPHTANLTIQTVQQLGWTLLPHPAYSPDLAPSDYHLFGNLKKPLRGKHFANIDEMKVAVNQWLSETPKEFFANGIRKLTKRWEKCVAIGGDYIEKFDHDSDSD